MSAYHLHPLRPAHSRPTSLQCAWQARGEPAPRRHAPAPARPRRSATRCRATANGEDAGSAWSRLSLAKRQLAVALAEEDYALCNRLKAEVASLEARLPPQKQLLLALLDKLQGADARERVTAAQALGDLGDAAALAPLQAQLSEPGDVGAVCESSMWCIFMQAPSLEVEALLGRGVAALSHPSQWEKAVEVFTQVIAAAPDFAEGYNKRATVYYLNGMHAQAIDDCRATLALNPWHFGAAAGMGMCCAAVKDYSGAISAFEAAVNINPRLGHLSHHIAQLRAMQAEQQRGQP